MADVDAGGLAGGAASGAMAGAAFGPYGMLAGAAIGMGLQLFGASRQQSAAREYNAAQVAQINAEKKVEEQRRQAMELDYHRKSLQNFREVQQKSAMSLAAATNQGAQFSSGYQGGSASVQSQGAFNQLGLNQNVEIGRNIFKYNEDISNARIAQANAGMNMQTAQGYAQLGGAIMGNLGTIGRITSGFGRA